MLRNNKRKKKAEYYKKRIKEVTTRLENDYNKGLISYEDYFFKLSKFLKGKTEKEWYEYYDNYIKSETLKLNKPYEFKSYNNLGLITFLLIILGLGVFANDYTGFAVFDIFKSKSIIDADPKKLDSGEILTIVVNPTPSSIYGQIYITKGNNVEDVINLNCVDVCYNKEIVNYKIANDWDGDYLVSAYDFNSFEYKSVKFSVTGKLQKIKKTGGRGIRYKYLAGLTKVYYPDGRKSAIFGAYNIKAKNGSYYPFKHLVKLKDKGNKLEVSVENEKYNILPKIKIKGKAHSLDEFKTLPGTKAKFEIKEHHKTYEFALLLNTTLTEENSFDEVLFEIEDLSIPQSNRTKTNNSHILNSKTNMSYKDLEDSGFDINVLNKDIISVTGVASKNNVYLDPTLVFDQPEISILEDGRTKRGSANMNWGISPNLAVGNEVAANGNDQGNEMISMIKFGLHSLPINYEVKNAFLSIYVKSIGIDDPGDKYNIRTYHVWPTYLVSGVNWTEGTGGSTNEGSWGGGTNCPVDVIGAFCYNTKPKPTPLFDEDNPEMNINQESTLNSQLLFTQYNATNQYYVLNVTNMVKNVTSDRRDSIWSNLTILLNVSDYEIDSAGDGISCCTGGSELVVFYSKEGSYPPTLTINYITLPRFEDNQTNATVPIKGEKLELSIKWLNPGTYLQTLYLESNITGSLNNDTIDLDGLNLEEYVIDKDDFLYEVGTTDNPYWKSYSVDDLGSWGKTNIQYINAAYYGTLNVSLQVPSSDALSIEQYKTTWFNATVNCTSGDLGCGEVFGILRYNETGNLPNKAVNISAGVPLNIIKVLGANPTSKWNWTKDVSNNDHDRLEGVAVDSNDNIYVVGYAASNAFYMAKLDGMGNPIKSRGFGAGKAFDIAIDSSDNIYIVGYNVTTDQNWRVMKLDTNLNNIWNRTYDAAGYNDHANGIAIDRNDNIYVVGFENSLGTVTDWRVEKLDSNGNIIWTRTYDVPNYGQAKDIAIDSNDNIYVAGFEKNADEDWRIMRIDSNGVNQWNRTYNPDDGGNDKALRVVRDSKDDLYIAGWKKNPSGDIYWGVMKLNNNGLRLWDKSYDLTGNTDQAYDVAIDSNDNIYVVGFSFPGFWRVMKLDTSGLNMWNGTYEANISGQARDMAIDSKDNLLIVGYENTALEGENWRVMKFQSYNNPARCNTNRVNGTILEENQVCDLRFKINGTGLDTKQLDVLFNSTNIKIDDNDTRNVNLTVIEKIVSVAIDLSPALKTNVNWTVKTLPVTNLPAAGNSPDLDDDNDLIINVSDNCITIANPDQLDTDYDKYGDACDDDSPPDGPSCIDFGECAPNNFNSLWSNSYNPGGGDRAQGIAIDSKDNVYVVGYEVATTQDWRIMKFNRNGISQWNKTYDFGGNEIAYGVAVDGNDNIYVVGYEKSNQDWKVMKFKSNGVGLWNWTYDSSANDIAYDVVIDSNHNILVVGSSDSTMSWGVIKLDSYGATLWDRKYFLPGFFHVAYDVAIDSNDNIYVVGRELVSGTFEWRIMKLNSTGVSKFNQSYGIVAVNDEAQGVAVDSEDNVYVVGTKGSGAGDWHIRKYDSNLALITSISPSGSASIDIAYDVAIDRHDNIYVVGIYDGDWKIMKFNKTLHTLEEQLYDFKFTDTATGIAVDFESNLYVAGYQDNLDWRIMRAGRLINPSLYHVDVQAIGTAASLYVSADGSLLKDGIGPANVPLYNEKISFNSSDKPGSFPTRNLSTSCYSIGINMEGSSRTYLNYFLNVSTAPPGTYTNTIEFIAVANATYSC